MLKGTSAQGVVFVDMSVTLHLPDLLLLSFAWRKRRSLLFLVGEKLTRALGMATSQEEEKRRETEK